MTMQKSYSLIPELSALLSSDKLLQHPVHGHPPFLLLDQKLQGGLALCAGWRM